MYGEYGNTAREVLENILELTLKRIDPKLISDKERGFGLWHPLLGKYIWVTRRTSEFYEALTIFEIVHDILEALSSRNVERVFQQTLLLGHELEHVVNLDYYGFCPYDVSDSRIEARAKQSEAGKLSAKLTPNERKLVVAKLESQYQAGSPYATTAKCISAKLAKGEFDGIDRKVEMSWERIRKLVNAER